MSLRVFLPSAEDGRHSHLRIHFAENRLNVEFGQNGIFLLFHPTCNPSAGRGSCLKSADLVLHCIYKAYIS